MESAIALYHALSFTSGRVDDSRGANDRNRNHEDSARKIGTGGAATGAAPAGVGKPRWHRSR